MLLLPEPRAGAAVLGSLPAPARAQPGSRLRAGTALREVCQEQQPRVARERDQRYRNKMIKIFGVSKGRLSSDAAARGRKKPRSGTVVGL